jgi:HAE1 family hydrophobic/amphiphilic exporter-1
MTGGGSLDAVLRAHNKRKGRHPLFVDFFIHRPVFATVCALLIILAARCASPTLPIAMYPTLAPPQVSGRPATTWAPTPIPSRRLSPFRWKKSINGVEGMRYISSSSTNSGTSSITTTFQDRLRPGHRRR